MKQIVIEFCHIENDAGYWIVVMADREEFHRTCFDSAELRDKAQAEILQTVQEQFKAQMVREH